MTPAEARMTIELIYDLRDDALDARDELEEVEGELDEARASLAKAEAERDEARAALAKMEAERDGVRAWRDLYTLERNEARRERDEAILALREWSEKIKTELAKGKKELGAKLDASEKALADAITARDRYRSQLIETEKARAHQRVELDGLRKVRDERDKTRLALEEQITQTARIQASLSEVHDALAKGGVRWNVNAAARVEELLGRCVQALAECDKVRAERDELKEKLDRLLREAVPLATEGGS